MCVFVLNSKVLWYRLLLPVRVESTSKMTACVGCNVGSDTNLITCEVCKLKTNHDTCLGVNLTIVTIGALAWKCNDCKHLSIYDVLTKMIPKLSLIDELASDVRVIKKTLCDTTKKTPHAVNPYLNALSKGLERSANPFKSDNRNRLDSTASDSSERKKRRLVQDPQPTTAGDPDTSRQDNPSRRKQVRQVNVVSGTASSLGRLSRNTA